MRRTITLFATVLLLAAFSWADDAQLQQQLASLKPGQQVDVFLKNGTKVKGRFDGASPHDISLNAAGLGFQPRMISLADVSAVKRVHRPIRALQKALAPVPLAIYCGLTFGKGCGEL